MYPNDSHELLNYFQGSFRVSDIGLIKLYYCLCTNMDVLLTQFWMLSCWLSTPITVSVDDEVRDGIAKENSLLPELNSTIQLSIIK